MCSTNQIHSLTSSLMSHVTTLFSVQCRFSGDSCREVQRWSRSAFRMLCELRKQMLSDSAWFVLCVSQRVRGRTGCATVRPSSWSGCCWALCSEEPFLTGTAPHNQSRFVRPPSPVAHRCASRLSGQVRQASHAAGVPVRARRVRPRARRPASAAALPGRALPDGRVLLLHQHQLLQPG